MSREGGTKRDFQSLAGFRAFGESENAVPAMRALFNRHSGARKARTRNLEIPGSLVSRAPRNDGCETPPRLLRIHPLALRHLMPEPGELPLGVMPGIGAADVSRLCERDLALEMPDQPRDAMGLHRRQQGI